MSPASTRRRSTPNKKPVVQQKKPLSLQDMPSDVLANILDFYGAMQYKELESESVDFVGAADPNAWLFARWAKQATVLDQYLVGNGIEWISKELARIVRKPGRRQRLRQLCLVLAEEPVGENLEVEEDRKRAQALSTVGLCLPVFERLRILHLDVTGGFEEYTQDALVDSVTLLSLRELELDLSGFADSPGVSWEKLLRKLDGSTLRSTLVVIKVIMKSDAMPDVDISRSAGHVSLPRVEKADFGFLGAEDRLPQLDRARDVSLTYRLQEDFGDQATDHLLAQRIASMLEQSAPHLQRFSFDPPKRGCKVAAQTLSLLLPRCKRLIVLELYSFGPSETHLAMLSDRLVNLTIIYDGEDVSLAAITLQLATRWTRLRFLQLDIVGLILVRETLKKYCATRGIKLVVGS